ncbi:hypothetical protein [Spiroplasma tabanidicola]|uniref:Uncharacterized protein n=1 Tax=Spiroplasma tabanidicola TaxID=324079 RepID=A0A6I6CCK7_9MOLU|nr:hypothetical protein [Spiroplasma tabanidicola]QGS52018.1 hypothetical protein STABA_v1c06570 [Spiroplasma tabanidicola]
MINIVIKLFLSIGLLFNSSFVTSSYKRDKFYNEKSENVNDLTFNYDSFLKEDKIIKKDNSKKDATTKMMYYGRILKYYYAKSVTKIKQEFYDSIIDVYDYNEYFLTYEGINHFGSKKTELNFYKALLVQNIIASTINISEYGATNDREFFAEAFSKWLLTPDSLKNKSWEITNYFFTIFFPELIKNGENQIDKKDSLLDYLFSKYDDRPIYNLDLEEKPNDCIDLGYESEKVGWEEFESGKSGNYLSTCFTSFFDQSIVLKIIDKEMHLGTYYYNLLGGWMNDSYTKASEQSIKYFHNFNSNYYDDFDALDAKLVENSKNEFNESNVIFKKIYDSIDNRYTNFFSIYKWKKSYTKELKDATLYLYNYLFSLIKNELWVNNILNSFVISSDEVLKDSSKNVLGYNATDSTFEDETWSISSSYIIIKFKGLIDAKNNNSYKTQWFSSPIWYSVLIHEMGHALDGFGGRLNSFRNKNDTSTKKYDYYYSGRKIGYDVDLENVKNIFLWVIFLCLTIGFISTVATLNIIVYLKRKKIIQNIKAIKESLGKSV